MTKSHKKILLGSIIFLFILSGGWLAFCHYVLKTFKAELAQLEITLKQQGFDISYEALEFHQHLFSFEINAFQPRIKSPKGFGWEVSKLGINLRPWNWRKITFSFPHTQDVILYYGRVGKNLSVTNAQGFVRLTKFHKLQEFSIDAEGISSFMEGKANSVSLRDVHLDLQNLSAPLDLDIAFTCEFKGLEDLLHLPLSSKPVTFALDARLGGFQTQKEFPASLEAWRDGGGVLDVHTLRFTWLPFEVKGDGTLTFDKEMYPLGSFSTRITGYHDGLNSLVAGNIIHQKNATMVEFVLDMLSRSNDKGIKEVQVPITLQDHKISVGSIPVWKG